MDLFQSIGNLLQIFINLHRQMTPGQLVIQISDRCNALCPQCGMRMTAKYARSKISCDDIKRILDAAARNGVKVVSFTGGEPMLFFDELVALIRHAGQVGIEYIRTGTNGFTFANGSSAVLQSRVNRIAETLVKTPLRNFWISLDSAIPAVHENMRGFPGVVKGIEKALPIFHAHGIYPSANLGINRRIGGRSTQFLNSHRPQQTDDFNFYFYRKFRNAFRHFYQFAIDLGFTIVNCCYPMSIDPGVEKTDLKSVYSATSEKDLVRFNPIEKALLFNALFDIIPEFRSKIRIFSPRSFLYSAFSEYQNRPHTSYPCRGGIDYFYINASDGNTYPCGFRGNENLGEYWDVNPDLINRKAACRLCEWECFRDPSELFGPLIDLVNAPLQLLKKIKEDHWFYRIWFDDLRYYRACDFFDGRKAPQFRKMESIV
jgi:MoaA/NifB/PqqE/SkfB family radical SAM enzyme